MPHFCKQGTAPLPTLASTILPPSNFVCPWSGPAQGVSWVIVLFFPQPVESHCPVTGYTKEKETAMSLNSTYTKQEKNRLGEDQPTTAVLKGCRHQPTGSGLHRGKN